ncbi:MAG: tyrosine-type recombinase/integrase [Clostridia bacterium]|nr:tyrosine-type recombinase/integrase [Clostridia bacterium]
MNKKCRPLEKEEYEKIIETITFGFEDDKGKCYPNKQIASVFVVQANTGLRIGDTLSIRLCDFVKDGNRYHFNNFREQKTKKVRTFTISPEIYTYMQTYALENGIKPDSKLFNISSRGVSKHLKRVCDYLGYERVGSHSFRKMYATEIYYKYSGKDIALISNLLSHSSIAITQRYIGVTSENIEKALQNYVRIPNLNQPELAKTI